MIDRFDYFIVF